MNRTAVFAVAVLASIALPLAMYWPFLRPLRFSDSDTLVRVWQVDEGHRFRDFSQAQFEVLEAEMKTSLEAVGGISFWRRTLQDGARTTTVTTGLVSPGFFDVFILEPVVGRHITSDELREGARVIVLNERFWTSFFARDPSVVGRSVRMRGQAYTIVGVLPDELRTPSRSTLWSSYPSDGPAARNQMIVMGRVKDRAALEVDSELRGLSVWHEPLLRARARHAWSSVLLVSSVMLTMALAAWLTLGRRISVKSRA